MKETRPQRSRSQGRAIGALLGVVVVGAALTADLVIQRQHAHRAGQSADGHQNQPSRSSAVTAQVATTRVHGNGPSIEATPTDVQPSSTAASPSPLPCDATSVDASVTGRQSYAFHYLNVITFTNHEDTSCELTGFPSSVFAYAPSPASAAGEMGKSANRQQSVQAKPPTLTGETLLTTTAQFGTDSPLFSSVNDAPVELAPGGTAGLYVGALRNPDDTDSCPILQNTVLAISLDSTSDRFIKVGVSIGLCDGGNFYVSPFLSDANLPSPG